MVSEAFINNTVTIITLVLLIGTLVLPRTPKFIIHSFLLMFVGIIPILYELKLIGFNLADTGIITYVITFCKKSNAEFPLVR